MNKDTTSSDSVNASTPTTPQQRPKISLSIDPRWLSLLLLAIIIGMLLAWRPWNDAPGASNRTVSVTGESTVKATPDEYSFNPNYQFMNADKDAAVKEASAKQAEVVAQLKTLGVEDKQIKTNVYGNQDYSVQPMESPRPEIIRPVKPGTGFAYNLQMTITVQTKEEAQKVQDYLATTSPLGTVTPYPTFSQALRKKLESKARDEATKDARGKADQSASNLGFKVGSVKSVDDGSGLNGGFHGLDSGAELRVTDAAPARDTLSVQPGENELNYNVTVVYYIK